MKIYYFKWIYICLLSLVLPGKANSQQVIVGTGTAISVFSPINRTNDYCVYEIIYLAADIGISGSISKFAFERVDGTNVDPIDSVSIFMQHTALNELMNASYSELGYTLVYSGAFPNDAGAGWREVTLDVPFAYDGTSNLQVLCVKGYQPAAANTPVAPRWYYTNISPSPPRARRYFGNTPISVATQLNSTSFSSNVRLDFSNVGVVEISNTSGVFYPNPALDLIQFNFPVNDGCLSVVDLSGRVVLRSPFHERATVATTGFSKGTYLFHLQDRQTGKIHTGKWINE